MLPEIYDTLGVMRCLHRFGKPDGRFISKSLPEDESRSVERERESEPLLGKLGKDDIVEKRSENVQGDSVCYQRQNASSNTI